MARTLKPKTIPAIVTIALELKRLGYDPIPLRSGKDKPFKGWPTTANEEADIKKFVGRSIALRTNGCVDTFFIDVDVQDEDARDKIIAAYCARWPEFMRDCVIRHSGGVKVMLIGRLITGKKMMHSARWGVCEQYKAGHRVELFTSNDNRYVAVWGMHSPGREYGYDGPELRTREQSGLPLFLDADLDELLDIADRVLAECGMVQAESGVRGSDETIYDLEPDMLWKLQDGSQVRLGDLEATWGGGGWMRGWPNLWEPGTLSRSGGRVKAKVTPGLGLLLWDTETEAKHRWKTLGPQPDVLTPLLKQLAARVDMNASMFGKYVPPGLAFKDLYAFLPKHLYIYVLTGDLWPMASVNAVLQPVPLKNKDGTPVMKGTKPVLLKPSAWLDRYRSVEQMTWAPGYPQTIIGKVSAEAGWVDAPGATTFNLYRPPAAYGGNGLDVGPWLDLVKKIYPDDVEHILNFFAHRIQKPAEKINHGLLLVGSPGIGKDTIIEPLRIGVGPWNFKEASPMSIMSPYNGYMVGVVLRVSETRDLGEVNRFALYEAMKTVLATPPDTTWVNIKFIPQYYVVNVCGTIITTNHGYDGVYLPADDRRHYVCGTDITAANFSPGYWEELWKWYYAGGLENVARFLAERDISAFDAKAPPKKTEAFWRVANTGVAPEVAELSDALDKTGTRKDDAGNETHYRLEVLTLDMVRAKASHGLKEWLDDRRNRRTALYRMESCGYVPVRNLDAKTDGLWKINAKRQVIYCAREVPAGERLGRALAFRDEVEKQAREFANKLKQAGNDEKGTVVPFSRE
jgi:hypothetical protein